MSGIFFSCICQSYTWPTSRLPI